LRVLAGNAVRERAAGEGHGRLLIYILPMGDLATEEGEYSTARVSGGEEHDLPAPIRIDAPAGNQAPESAHHFHVEQMGNDE